jgi:hypothetical protein
MNFDGLPLIHRESGAWMATGFMVIVAVGLVTLFWNKRYLARTLPLVNGQTPRLTIATSWSSAAPQPASNPISACLLQPASSAWMTVAV